MAALLLILIPLTCFGPGFFLVRKLRWDPLEKLCAAIGLSLVMLYLLSFAIFVLGLSWGLTWLVSLASVGLLAISRRELRRLWGVRRVRQVLGWGGALFLWNLLQLTLVRHLAGGYWCCDWYEHYQRALHFLTRGPTDYLFFNVYLLPARPPLMNLVTTFLQAQVGTSFLAFQIVTAFLNLLVFLPLLLLARTFTRRGGGVVAGVAAVLALSPMVSENAAFTWTKAHVGFYVVLALWLYLAGWRKQDPFRMGAAFFSLAAAVLTHYSAGPYVVFLALHFLGVVLITRRERLKGLLLATVPSALLLATWFSWSLHVYGVAGTFASNSTVTESEKLGFTGNLLKVGENIFNTLVPHLLRPGHLVHLKTNGLRQVIDNLFYLYQVNLPFSMGSVGVVLIALLFVRGLRAKALGQLRSERRFWLAFVLAVVPLGIAVHGNSDQYGVAHICLQPFTAMALTFLVTRVRQLPRWAGGAWLVGAAIDFALGRGLHLYMSSSVEEWAIDGNLHLKRANHYDLVYLGDLLAGVQGPLSVLIALGVLFWLWRLKQEVAAPLAARQAAAAAG